MRAWRPVDGRSDLTRGRGACGGLVPQRIDQIRPAYKVWSGAVLLAAALLIPLTTTVAHHDPYLGDLVDHVPSLWGLLGYLAAGLTASWLMERGYREGPSRWRSFTVRFATLAHQMGMWAKLGIWAGVRGMLLIAPAIVVYLPFHSRWDGEWDPSADPKGDPERARLPIWRKLVLYPYAACVLGFWLLSMYLMDQRLAHADPQVYMLLHMFGDGLGLMAWLVGGGMLAWCVVEIVRASWSLLRDHRSRRIDS